MPALATLILLAQTNTPTPTPTATPVSHLSGSDQGWSLAVIVAFLLLAGVIVTVGRGVLEGSAKTRAQAATAGRGVGARADTTFLRSWLAIALVGGLLIFVALSFWLDDTALRSALVGGVVANAGAAVAFYFASKSSDQARRDILSASQTSVLVPDLAGQELPKVNETLAATSLRLEVQPPTPVDGAQVVEQHPAASQFVAPGSAVAVSLAGPVPDLTHLTVVQAQAKLAGSGLSLVPAPATPAENATVQGQEPRLGDPVPRDRRVHADFA